MSDIDCDCDCDCDPDCCDFDCCDFDCCDMDCCLENCCGCDSCYSGGCWYFCCFGGGEDTSVYFIDSSNSRSNPESRSYGSGGRHVTQKAGPKPKPKKRSRFKRILLFWKTNKRNDQEQKPVEEELDHMPSQLSYPHVFGPPRGYHHHEFGHPRNFSYRTERIYK